MKRRHKPIVRASVRATAALPLLLLLAGCRLEPENRDSDGRTDEYLGETGACIVMTTAEYGASGALALLDPDTLQVFTDVTATHHDATVSLVGPRRTRIRGRSWAMIVGAPGCRCTTKARCSRCPWVRRRWHGRRCAA